MSPIKPKPDRKPGARAQRFTGMLDPNAAMVNVLSDVETASVEDVVKLTVETTDQKVVKTKQPDGQPIRIDRSLWRRLKSLQLELEGQGERKTLMELTNEALAVYLAERGK